MKHEPARRGRVFDLVDDGSPRDVAMLADFAEAVAAFIRRFFSPPN
jgi:hypothetical protein